MTAHHKVTENDIYSGRKSEVKEYWYQYVKCNPDLEIPANTGKDNIALLAYAGDVGVKRNHGRLGAAEGPTAIRKMIGSMSYHLPNDVAIIDFGTIETDKENMEASHEQIEKFTLDLLQKNYFPVLLGGGHDLAFPHGSAVIEFARSKGKKLGIINLDAHFDLREKIDGKGHSGSPFFQLAEKFASDFNYLCLGIQPAANPQSLFKKAKELQASWVVASNLNLTNWEAIDAVLEEFLARVDFTYLTVDMDGFHSGIAPGVSAPSPTGYAAEVAFKIVEKIGQSKKLLSFDVVEVNPKYDRDNATARLAARMIEYIISCTFPSTDGANSKN